MRSEAPAPFGATASRTAWRSVAYYLAPLAAALGGLTVLAGGDLRGQRLVLGSLGLVALMRIAGWWRRTFAFEADRLVVEEGILQRTQRVVPYDRIQQVDLHADVRARVLGAASVRVEVAGDAGGRGVRLDVIPVARARELQEYVLGRRGAAAAGTEPEAEALGRAETVLLALPVRRLMLAGLMSDAVGVAAAGAAGVAGFVWQLGLIRPEDLVARAESRTALEVVIAALLVLAPVAAALAEVYRYGGYRLTLVGDDLHLQHGLVETRRLTLPRRRVQIVTVQENAVGRRLGMVGLVLASASRPGEREPPSALRVPILPRRELESFLVALMGDDAWAPPPLVPRPAAARRRAVVRRTLPLLAAAALGVLLTPWTLLLLPVAAALGVLWGRAAHARAGHAATPHLAALAAGVLVHRLHLVPHDRLQSARTTTSPLQRRSRLATLHLDVAGRRGAPRLLDVEAGAAHELVRRLPLRGAGG